MRSSTIVLTAIALVGCQNSNVFSNVAKPFGSGGSAGVSVAVGDSLGSTTPSFRPGVDTIATTDTVAWVVDSGAPDAPFNVTWDGVPSGATWPSNSADLRGGQSYLASFTQAGWYSYHCTHHTNMTGSLYVLPSLGSRIPRRVERLLAARTALRERQILHTRPEGVKIAKG